MDMLTGVNNLQELETLLDSYATTETLRLDEIDHCMQMRVKGTDQELVEDYAAKLENGADLGRLRVFVVDMLGVETNVLVDGYHRSGAHKLRGTEEVECVVYRGRTPQEAKLYAMFANVANGRGASNEDIRSALGHLLSEVTIRERFVTGSKLDVAELAKFTGFSLASVKRHTVEFRENLEATRDAQIEVMTEQGVAKSEIAKELGVATSTVGNQRAIQKSSVSENVHPDDPLNLRAPNSPFLKLLQNVPEETLEDEDDDLFLIDEEERHITKCPDKLKAVEEASKRREATITAAMKRGDKPPRMKTPKKKSPAELWVTSFAGFTEYTTKAQTDDPTYKNTVDFINQMEPVHKAAALNDVAVMLDALQNLHDMVGKKNDL